MSHEIPDHVNYKREHMHEKMEKVSYRSKKTVFTGERTYYSENGDFEAIGRRADRAAKMSGGILHRGENNLHT